MSRSLSVYPLLALACLGCDGTFFEPEPANSPVGNFDELWATFSEKYAVFEQRGVDWDAQYEDFRPQVNVNSSEAGLYGVLTSMMATLDDAHVSLIAPNQAFWSGHQEFRQPTAADAFSGDLIRDTYLGGVFNSYRRQILYGRVDPDVGYMLISHFQGDELTVIDDILESMAGVRGVIVDLRRNRGGDFTNGQVLVSRFADERRLAFSARPKNGPGPNDFAAPVDYFIEPEGGRFAGSVVLLVDRYTLSAGESIVLFFRVLPNVTIVGEPTAGAMGERIEKELPNGWIYSITGQLITAADGNSYEGPGIPPDLEVTNSAQEISNGIDRVLDVAIAMILN